MRKLLMLGLWPAAVVLQAQNPWMSLQQLVGTWKNLRREAVEQWRIVAPDTLKGASYALTPNGPVLMETLVLFRRPNGSIVYRTTVAEQSEGRAADFSLTFFTASSWTFESLEHRFPQTIEYWLVDSISLRVTLSSSDEAVRELWFSRTDESALRMRPALRGYQAWICNRKSGTIERFDAHTGAPMGRFYVGSAPAHDLCLGPDGQAYILTSGSTPTVLRLTPAAGQVATFLQGYALQAPTAMAFGPDGHLYVCERTGALLRFDGTSGRLMQTLAEGLPHPVALTWDVRGRLLVACAGGRGVWLVSSQEATPRRVTPEGSLKAPTSLCLVSNGDMLVADADETASIKRFRPEGDAWTYAGPVAHGFGWPEGLTLGPDGYLYACDSRMNTLRKIDPATHTELGIYLDDHTLNGPVKIVFYRP